MKGLFGKIMIIDLSGRTWREEPVPDEVYEHFLGGKGLGAYLLLQKNKPGIDPLSAENHLMFCLGPANDTRIWGTSRYAVITKSPLTGLFSESYSGGRVTEPMSRTGYDAIVLEGASDAPVFLEVTEGAVRFHDASSLWGTDSYEAEEAIRRVTGRKDAGIVVIGPAGERLVRFSTIMNNRGRCAGRTGVGAVLGSKKVKGIAFYGTKQRDSADPHRIEELRKLWLKKGNETPGVNAFRKLGTPGLVAPVNAVEAFPTRYWADGSLDGWEEIGAEALHTKFSVRARSCNRCFIACSRVTTVTSGRHAGLVVEGPEYETIYAFGGLCMIKDLGEIIYLNDLCDRLGLDTISAGNLAAFTIEAGLRGRIAEKISYGDAERIAALLTDIAQRRGTGAVLAEGIRQAAKEWDLEDLAIHVKGMEPAGYDPRYFKAMALAYATSDRGACHLRSTAFRPELTGIIAPEQIEGKAQVVVDFEDRSTLQDALIVCRFYRDLYMWEEMAQIVEVTTGTSCDRKRLEKIASTIRNAARIFNLREGMTGAADTLPRRFFEEPLGSKKSLITRQQFDVLKSDYYRLRRWNEKGEPLEDLPIAF